MPRIVIDNQEIEVEAGSTLLAAARRLGLDVPALCFLEGCRPNTACMVCLMKVKGSGKLVPSCATVVEDGLCVESETEEVREARRTALELLLSDHAGECRAPCQYACPFDSNVPEMLRQIAGGRIDEAIETVRRDIPLAAVLARISPDPCEAGCRRCAIDESAAIGLLKQYVADRDLALDTPYLPPCKPPTDKRVAIVGAGPAGLSAAYFLLQQGHACTLFEVRGAAGGTLSAIDEDRLPRAVLRSEIALLEKLGTRFVLNTKIEHADGLAALRNDHDAVLFAVGKLDEDSAAGFESITSGGCVNVDQKTHQTDLPDVFAAGDAVRPRGQPISAAADGKAAAHCINQYLHGEPVTGRPKLANLRLPRPQVDELAAMASGASAAARIAPGRDKNRCLTDDEARTEAERCLHCDCEKVDHCRLRVYAERFGADASRYRGERRRLEPMQPHPEIVYQPGKCILCGLCIQIAEQADEPLGLTYIGRGFDVRVGVPFDGSLAEGLKLAARRCAEACPTGALARRNSELCEDTSAQ